MFNLSHRSLSSTLSASVFAISALSLAAGSARGSDPAAAPSELSTNSPAASLAEARLSALLAKLALLPTPMRDAACDSLFGPNKRHAPPVGCFAPGTSDEIIASWKSAMEPAGPFGPRFQPALRWIGTALDPLSTGEAGQPTILTYSFVPDGTTVPAEFNQPDRPSDLFSFFDGIYGSTQAWQDLYHDVFLRWGEVSGLTFVYEPNDDGVRLVDNDGIPGVRGDLRLSGAAIDGNFGILAYNYYPFVGDMVIDTSDGYWAPRLGNDSRTLRNVIAHEVGHGLGMAHVCPVTTTKLMEPFVSDVFDGLRHDDIRHAHFWYGDAQEPNDQASDAVNLGTLPRCQPLTFGPVQVPGVATPYSSSFSVNSDADLDFFRFSPSSISDVTVTITPVGYAYDDSPQGCSGQTASCCSGLFIDSEQLADLTLDLFNAGDVFPFATANLTGVGGSETLTFAGSALANYYARVSTTSTVDSPQSYTVSLSALPALSTITIDAPPSVAQPSTPTTITARITRGSAFVQTTNLRLYYRINGGALASVATARVLGTNGYVANLPGASCGDVLTYYVSAPLTTGQLQTVSDPCREGASYTLRVGEQTTLLADSFETDQGWTVTSSNLSDGAWERAQPIDDPARGAPIADADGNGWCYLSDNQFGNSDVDGGPTIVTSPLFSAVSYTSVQLKYSRWFANNSGDGDIFAAEVSNDDGATWTTLETTGTAHFWSEQQFDLLTFVPATANMRVRFSATDNPNNSVTEAAVDAVTIVARRCLVASCYADFDQSGGVDGQDVEAFFLDWQAGLNSADTNEDGGVDGQDVETFFRQWQAGGC